MKQRQEVPKKDSRLMATQLFSFQRIKVSRLLAQIPHLTGRTVKLHLVLLE